MTTMQRGAFAVFAVAAACFCDGTDALELSPPRATRVKRVLRRCGLTSVETNVVYGVARKA